MTIYEVAARQRKAQRLASVLLSHGADGESAAALPDAGWRMAAELAGVRLPSQATRELVVSIVRASRSIPTVTPDAGTAAFYYYPEEWVEAIAREAGLR